MPVSDRAAWWKNAISALPGSKIGHMQAEVGIDDPHQGDIREVQPFGNHLRADEDVDLAISKSTKNLLVGLFARRRICIHSHDSGFRKTLIRNRFHALRSDAREPKCGVTTLRALRGYGP